MIRVRSSTTRRWSAPASGRSSTRARLEVVGEAGDGAEAVALAASDGPTSS